MSNDRPLSDSQLGALGARYWLGEAGGGLADRPMNPLDPNETLVTGSSQVARFTSLGRQSSFLQSKPSR